MKTVTASEAKQRLGQLLSSVPDEGLAIQKHGKTVAVLVKPGHAPHTQQAAREARAAQSAMDQLRLNRHLRIALELLTDADRAEQLITAATREVDRWETDGLCSADYIDRWRTLLALEPGVLARDMCGELDGWGTALRQNSPWSVVA